MVYFLHGLTLVLIALKLTGYIAASWLVVLAPSLLVFGLAALVVTAIMIFALKTSNKL